jgi:hypothetical protein
MPGVGVTTVTGPRDPNDATQTFNTEILDLSGNVTAETDCNLFDDLTIRAGRDQGLPASLGQTTLSQSGTGGDWAVDSFFDVWYEIEYVGDPNGPIAGMSGTTLGNVTMGTVGATVPARIPALSAWGMAALVLLLMVLAGIMLRRRAARSGPATRSG